MIHVTCRLTAKNRDQLRNPTLGNRVWATFTFSGLGWVSHMTGRVESGHTKWTHGQLRACLPDEQLSISQLMFHLSHAGLQFHAKQLLEPRQHLRLGVAVVLGSHLHTQIDPRDASVCVIMLAP